MKRSPLPPRAVPLLRTATLTQGTPLARTGQLQRSSRLSVVSSDGAAVHPIRAARTHPAAFTPKVRKLVRDRAGNKCEACGVPLPPGAGQLQHRVARGMGGSRNPVLGSPANAVLLCGTPATGCHGRCEARDAEMHANGFWLWQYESPLIVPVRLHGRVTTWLLPDGLYSYQQPQGAA